MGSGIFSDFQNQRRLFPYAAFHRLVFVMDTDSVACHTGTEVLYAGYELSVFKVQLQH
jgi:hypothetical protein